MPKRIKTDVWGLLFDSWTKVHGLDLRKRARDYISEAGIFSALRLKASLRADKEAYHGRKQGSPGI